MCSIGNADGRAHAPLHGGLHDVGVHEIEARGAVRAHVIRDVLAADGVVDQRAFQIRARLLDEPRANGVRHEALVARARAGSRTTSGRAAASCQNRRSIRSASCRQRQPSRLCGARPASACNWPRADSEPRSAAKTSRPIASFQLCGTCAPSAVSVASRSGRLGVAALRGVEQQTRAVLRQQRPLVADDEPLAELRHRVEIAVLRGARQRVDRVVVAAREIVLGG